MDTVGKEERTTGKKEGHAGIEGAKTGSNKVMVTEKPTSKGRKEKTWTKRGCRKIYSMEKKIGK